VQRLQQFREELYQLFESRRDALVDLLDALCGSGWARSVVEVSLSPLFRREYGSLYDAIDEFFQASRPEAAAEERREWNQKLGRLVGRYLPAPPQGFWLVGTDVVPLPRPFARTLEDRTWVYQPNPVGSNAPVTIGHPYSVVALLPEKEPPDAPPWVIPLQSRRVASDEKGAVVGAEQLKGLLEDAQQPFHGALCVNVSDRGYSGVEFLGPLGALPNLVNVVRSAENRVFYRAPAPPVAGARGQGHPRWYGERFALKDPTTWGAPDEEVETTWTTRRGKTYRVPLQAWHHLRMPGTREYPMHRYPFTLVRARVLDEQGQPVFQRTLWLIVLGERRGEVSPLAAWKAYGQRFDLEHYFRFGKQRLLLASFQTPDVEHEENWVTLVQLAMVQLWLGRELAGVRLRSWERYLPTRRSGVASPSQVRRDWERIIRLIGTPAKPPQRRGKAPGRSRGASPGRRPRRPVIKKAPRGRSTPAP
jgi:hypothetical protein